MGIAHVHSVLLDTHFFEPINVTLLGIHHHQMMIICSQSSSSSKTTFQPRIETQGGPIFAADQAEHQNKILAGYTVGEGGLKGQW